VTGAVDAQHLAAHQFQPVARLGPPDLLVQQAADIGAEQLARHEGAGRRHHAHQLGFGLRLQPVEEMAGLVVERAHPARRHVQKMAGIGGGIGLPPTKLSVALNQIDFCGRRTAAEQVQ
jgi:hypothetical protein